MPDLCTFEELEAMMPKKIKCPECGDAMSIEMEQLGNTNHPTHEVEYHCDSLDCLTTVNLTANADFVITRADVTTGNHGHQELYGVSVEKVMLEAAQSGNDRGAME